MRWTVHGERSLYESDWVRLRLVDVEIPGGERFEHHVVRAPQPAAGVVVASEDRTSVLLLWRHRFITDTWAWEIPHGSVRPGEDPARAAARETEEETGWRPTGPIRPLAYTQPSPGLMTSEHHIFHAEGATHIGPPKDGFESSKVDWVSLDDVTILIDRHDIVAGTTLVALLYLLSNRQRR